MDFPETYKSITSKREKRFLRQKIEKACYVTSATFYTWLRRSSFPVLAQIQIANIMQLPQSELFPEYLQPKK